MNRILLFVFLLSGFAVSAQQLKQPVPATRPAVKTNNNLLLQNKIAAKSLWEEQEKNIHGFSRVMRNNQFSFIDKNDQLICAIQFDDARNFMQQLAAVKKDNKWGFINEAGKVVIPFEYDIVYDFKEAVTVVFKNGKWLLIDNKASVLKVLDIDVCYGFSNGHAKLLKGSRTGEMNTAGEIVFTGSINEPMQDRTAPATGNASFECPENIDFENGNFTNWNCFTGYVDSSGTNNVITVTPSAPIANRHRIIPRVMPSAIDPYGLFPTNPPDGSNFAVRLGNTRIGAEAERIQYVIRIPANDSNFSIRYDYAVVFQDPGHTAWTQPRFTAKLFDSAANAYIDCASFEYIATSNLPGFAVSTVDTSVIYKPWASAFISLRGQAGKTLYLEFTTADCVRRGHWGYAYVDVESTCSHAIDMSFDCGTGIAVLNAPPGFQSYNWWNQDYSALLGNGQHIILDPAPAANSTIWLELIPFSDFGCRDSMPVTITNTFSPHFDISERVAICAPHRFTFYNRDLPSTAATWDFGDGQSGTGDTVSHVYALPGMYIVTLNVTLASGCNGTFSDRVKILQPTGNFNYTGGNFCNSRAINFIANGTNIDSLKWDFGDGSSLVNTQLNISHTYSLAGTYLPNLTLYFSGGCSLLLPGTDSIKVERLLAGFKSNQQRNCGNAVVDFIDTSHSYFGISSYEWNFGDGHSGIGNTTSHLYSATGNYNVQLIITGINGCRDTVSQQINVLVNDRPVATIAGPLSECFLAPITFNGTVQSADAVATMQWISSDGQTGTGNSFDVNFAQPGNYNIQLLVATVNGCRDTAVHQVTINALPEMTLPNDLEFCDGATVAPVIFTGSIAGTTFTWVNDNPLIGLAPNGTGNIPAFVASNSTAVEVEATITVSPFANGCRGNDETFIITVSPLPSVPPPADQVVCNRGLTTPVIFNSFSAVSAGNISWTNDLPSIGLPANGVGNIVAFTAMNDSPFPVTATIVISVSNNGCQGLSQTFRITVYPTPNPLPIANQAVCNGITTNSLQFETAVNNSSFSWTNDLPTIGLPPNGTDSIGSFIAVNNTTAVLTAHILVTASANGCQGSPVSFSIHVNPIPTVNQPIDQAVCTGNPTGIINFSGAVNGTSYGWINNVPGIGLAGNGQGNILSFNPNNTSNTNLVAMITVTPTANGCNGLPKDFSITVFPTPGMIQPLNQFQCNGETTFPMTFTSPVAGSTFTWTNNLPAVGLPASGSGNIPSFTTYNPTNTSITAAITVTPATNDCPGISKTFYITVDPTPGITQPPNKTVCNGETVTATAFTGTVSGTAFSWINSAAVIGLAANGTGDIPSFTATNHTNFPVTAVIQVTGSANSCGSVGRVFTITVNPSPAVDAPEDQVVCNGIATTAIPLTGPVSGTNFSWKNNKPSIGLPAVGTGDIPSFTAINTSATPIVATIIVLGMTNNCGAVLDTLTITVNPSAAIQANNNTNICLGNTVQLSANGATQYSWTPTTGLSCNDCANPVATPTDSILYTVKGISNLGCAGLDSVLLMVRKPFDMLVPPNDTMCTGRSAILRATNADRYLWSPADGLDHTDIANPTATPTATTHYRVIGYDAYHCFTDTGYVTIAVGPTPAVHIGANISTSNGTPMTFHPTTQNGPIVRYSWTPATELSCSDCPAPSTIIKNNIIYTLTVENSFGCVASDSIMVTAFCKKAEVFVPNAFTPDGDGLNDVLVIRGSGIMVKSFRVYSRWGEVIFEKKNFNPNDIKYGWDGKIRGIKASPDVYIYTAEVICDNGTVYTYKGNTTILK